MLKWFYEKKNLCCYFKEICGLFLVVIRRYEVWIDLEMLVVCFLILIRNFLLGLVEVFNIDFFFLSLIGL